MPPNHIPLKRRRLLHHTVKHWYGLHSFLLPLIMDKRYMLAQSDSLNALLWDAARAFSVGVAFVWATIPAPVQILSGIMAIHLLVIVRAAYLRKRSAPKPGTEIWRMIYTLLILLVLRGLVQMTNTTVLPVLFIGGVLGWWEAVLMIRTMILSGTQFPPIVERFVNGMFKLQSRKFAKWARILDDDEDDEPKGDPAAPPDKQTGPPK